MAEDNQYRMVQNYKCSCGYIAENDCEVYDHLMSNIDHEVQIVYKVIEETIEIE